MPSERFSDGISDWKNQSATAIRLALPPAAVVLTLQEISSNTCRMSKPCSDGRMRMSAPSRFASSCLRLLSSGLRAATWSGRRRLAGGCRRVPRRVLARASSGRCVRRSGRPRRILLGAGCGCGRVPMPMPLIFSLPH